MWRESWTPVTEPHLLLAGLSLSAEITCSPENNFSPSPKTMWRQSEDEAPSRLYSCRSVVGYTSTPHSDQWSITSHLLSLLESSDVLTEESKTNLKLISVPTLPRQTHKFFNPSPPPSTGGGEDVILPPTDSSYVNVVPWMWNISIKCSCVMPGGGGACF